MAASNVTLNPGMRVLMLDEVKAELPRIIRQIQTLRRTLTQFSVGSAGWTAVAKSHDALVMQARRYKRFINAHIRAEQAQADFIRKMITGEVQAEVEQLIALIQALDEAR